jgi:hypothetical protein
MVKRKVLHSRLWLNGEKLLIWAKITKVTIITKSPLWTLQIFVTSYHISLRFTYLSVMLSSVFSLPKGLSYSMSLKYCTYTDICLTSLLWLDNSQSTSWRVFFCIFLSNLAIRSLNFTSHYSFTLGPVIILKTQRLHSCLWSLRNIFQFAGKNDFSLYCMFLCVDIADIVCWISTCKLLFKNIIRGST